MKINRKLSNVDVVTTSRSSKMTLSGSAQSIIFDMMTGNIYSDKIGSFIREIASNCFDSHVEAGTDSTKNPVVVSLQDNREIGEQSYISFIDKGIGMNPYRFIKIYANYFESSKNETDDLIGGFGLGGKTPLAYSPEGFFVITVGDKKDDIDFCKTEIDALNKKLSELEEGDNDKEITLIEEEINELQQRLLTVGNLKQDRIEYTYSVFNGTETPEYQLMNLKGIDRHKGSEIKIPLKDCDIATVESKTLRQLYYFENIVFKGFSDRCVTNDYNIVRGKNFVYRGDNYDTKMHVCLGKVAYPIDYTAMGLDQYSYDMPIAIKLNVGELKNGGVIVSREAIDYSDDNIEIIKNKMNAAIKELTGLLSKQYNDVVTLSDYYKNIEGNFGHLNLKDNVSIYIGNKVNKNELNLKNFKFKECEKIADSKYILDELFNVKSYGKRTGKYDSQFTNDLNQLTQFNSIYHVDGEFNRKNIKQAFLKDKHNTFYVLLPKKNKEEMFNRLYVAFGLTKQIHDTNNDKYDFEIDVSVNTSYYNMQYHKLLVSKKKAESLIKDIVEEINDIVLANTSNYDDVEVTEEYLEKRKAKREKEKGAFGKDTINVSFSGYGGNYKLPFKNLDKLSGRIVYGFRDDKHELYNTSLIADELGAIVNNYGLHHASTKKEFRGMIFIQIAKNNEKYMKALGRKAYHVKDFYERFVSRKVDKIVDSKMKNVVRQDFNNVHHLLGHNAMKAANVKLYNAYNTIKENLPEKHMDLFRLNNTKMKEQLGVDLNNLKGKYTYQKEIDLLVSTTEKNIKKLHMIEAPYNFDDENYDKELKKHFVGLLSMCI